MCSLVEYSFRVSVIDLPSAREAIASVNQVDPNPHQSVGSCTIRQEKTTIVVNVPLRAPVIVRTARTEMVHETMVCANLGHDLAHLGDDFGSTSTRQPEATIETKQKSL